MTGPPRHPVEALSATAPSKVNMGWRVGAVRPDGFHEVWGNICKTTLADHLDFTFHVDGDLPAGMEVVVGRAPLRLGTDPALEVDDNLVVRAAQLLADHARPTHIEVTKRIPVAAGLGGGSADAAATLLALNVGWGARLRPARLLELGAEIGSDVPALLLSGLVHVSGRGEVVRSIGAVDGVTFVLGISEESLSTPDVYAAFDGLPPQEPTSMFHNDLEAAAVSLLPALADRLSAMRTVTDAAFVAGSGPTVVGVCGSTQPDLAELDGVFHRVEVAGAATSVSVGGRRS